MDLNEALKKRRSVRRFSKKRVPDDAIAEIVEAGSFAPSSCNRQPWRVKAFRDDRAFKLVTQKIFLDAPVTLAVYCLDAYPEKEKKIMPFLDTGFFAQNLLLKAHELGLGACPIASTAFDQAAARKLFGLPPRSVLTLLVALGYPAESPAAPRRRSARELLGETHDSKAHDSEAHEREFKARENSLGNRAVEFAKTIVVVAALPVLAVKWVLQRERVKRETGVDETVRDKARALIKRPWF